MAAYSALILIVHAFLRVVLADPTDNSTADLVYRILAKQQDTVAKNQAGEMDFEIKHKRGNSTITYRGRVFWRFPCVRWEHERTIDEVHKSSSAQVIIIDNPKEIIRQDLTNNAIFRSEDHSRSYDAALKLAPWDLWAYMDGALAWDEVLDISQIDVDEVRSISARDNGHTIAIALEAKGEKISMLFAAESGMIESYDTSGASALFKGDFQWTQIDGHLFPTSFRYWGHATSQRAEPIVSAKLDNFSTTCTKPQSEFYYASLERPKGAIVTSFRKGAVIARQQFGKEAERPVSEVLQELGKRAAEKGFANE